MEKHKADVGCGCNLKEEEVRVDSQRQQWKEKAWVCIQKKSSFQRVE